MHGVKNSYYGRMYYEDAPLTMVTLILTEKIILNSDLIIFLPIMLGKNIVENVDLIFLNIADQSFLVKKVLNMHHKCLQADIAHNKMKLHTSCS